MEQPPRRPATPPNQTPSHAPAPASTHQASKKSRSKMLGWIALVIAIFVITGLVFLSAAIFGKAQSGSQIDVRRSQYQAVFLNNNQVYFGKITNITDRGITLKDIYYLQVQQNVQSSDDKSKTQQQQQQNLSLAKLGGELHGPEDQMFINRDQVLFWENLKDDGKVVQAIKNNQTQK